jgi:hypothetical protein
MADGCPTACGMTWCEGEAGCPVAVVWLPGRRAGGGRPQGRPCGRVEKVVTSRERSTGLTSVVSGSTAYGFCPQPLTASIVQRGSAAGRRRRPRARHASDRLTAVWRLPEPATATRRTSRRPAGAEARIAPWGALTVQGWAACTECVRAVLGSVVEDLRTCGVRPHHVGRVHKILLVGVGLADEEHFAVAGHDPAVVLAVDGTMELELDHGGWFSSSWVPGGAHQRRVIRGRRAVCSQPDLIIVIILMSKLCTYPIRKPIRRYEPIGRHATCCPPSASRSPV